MTQMNNQGITNYPQYGTNFWGSSADNNYGFGTSNIENNIENRQQTMPPVPQMATQPSISQSQLTSPRTVYQSLSGFSPSNRQWYENNPQKSDLNYIQDSYETDPLTNDCLKSNRFKQFVSNIKQPNREGYGYHISDQPTNSGISQGWYNSFRQQNPIIAQNYSENVKKLTKDQIDNLYCQGFYKPLHNEIYNDDFTSEHIFDIGVNIGGNNAPSIIQNAVNDVSNQKISTNGGIGTETVSAINNLKNEDLINLNNRIVDRREDYYRSKYNPSFEKGWLNRSELFRR